MVDAARTPLTLRTPLPDDGPAARDAHRSLAAEGFPFLVDHRVGERWPDYVARLERARRGDGVPDGWVPHTFLLAQADGELVGRVSVRHSLTPALALVGGHIGYAVLPRHRWRGHATAMLRAALAYANGLGLERVLLTCDDANRASAAVIERCGGALDDVVAIEGGPLKRRYWVATGDCPQEVDIPVDNYTGVVPQV